MQYFIIFLWIFFIIFFVWQSLRFYRRLRQKLRETVILKVTPKKENAEFFSNYVFDAVADIIFKAPRSRQKELLKVFFSNNEEPVWKYIKTKNKTLYEVLKGKDLSQISLKSQSVFGLMMAGWYFFETGAPEKVAHILKKLPQRGLSDFEKNLKKLFQAGQHLHQTDLKKAARKADIAAVWFHQQKFWIEEAEADLLLAEIFRMSGLDDNAEVYMRHAKKLYHQCGSERGLAKLKALEGVECLCQKDFEHAKINLQESLKEAQRNKQIVLECQILNQLARLYHDCGQKKRGLHFAKTTYQKVQKIKDKSLKKRLENQSRKYL